MSGDINAISRLRARKIAGLVVNSGDLTGNCETLQLQCIELNLTAACMLPKFLMKMAHRREHIIYFLTSTFPLQECLIVGTPGGRDMSHHVGNTEYTSIGLFFS